MRPVRGRDGAGLRHGYGRRVSPALVAVLVLVAPVLVVGAFLLGWLARELVETWGDYPEDAP